jgi:hypothetical protein
VKHDLTCNRTQKLLALLPGSDLPPELDQPVRDHLAGCTACQRRLGDHLRVRSVLGRAAPREHPGLNQGFFANLKGDILRAVAADRARYEAQLARVSSRRLRLARWMTAAAILLLAVYLVPQMLAPRPVLPDDRDSGAVRSVHHRGPLPAVGLQGQQEVLEMLDPDRDGIVVLDGSTFRLVLRKDSR